MSTSNLVQRLTYSPWDVCPFGRGDPFPYSTHPDMDGLTISPWTVVS